MANIKMIDEFLNIILKNSYLVILKNIQNICKCSCVKFIDEKNFNLFFFLFFVF